MTSASKKRAGLLIEMAHLAATMFESQCAAYEDGNQPSLSAFRGPMTSHEQGDKVEKLSTAVDNCVRNYFWGLFTKSKA